MTGNEVTLLTGKDSLWIERGGGWETKLVPETQADYAEIDSRGDTLAESRGSKDARVSVKDSRGVHQTTTFCSPTPYATTTLLHARAQQQKVTDKILTIIETYAKLIKSVKLKFKKK